MTSTTGRRTRRALVALLGISSLVLAACGGSDDSSTEEPAAEPAAAEEPAEASADPVRIALVAPSAINDLAFTQSMYDSVQRVADNRDVTLDVSDGLFIVEDAG
ncbi:MAG: BMP family ABC transporter substrate-binding protein, partial [Actinomycetota bacterium]|nr:BMP family ABC transporter substrate-binding protein [Actinomycetota bacterium]